MRRDVVWFMLFAVIGVWGDGRVSAESPLPPDVQAMVGGVNRFTFDLYAQVASDPGNIFCSPLSVHAALMMSSAGARGATASEMSEALRVPPSLSAEASQRADALLLDALQSPDERDFQLHIASGLWGQKDFTWLPAFRDVLASDYHSDIYTVDFADAESASRQINDWVSQHTSGRITQLFAPGAIPQNAKLVLGNAVYFKGDWESPFEHESTRDGPFHLSAQADPVTTPMMRQHGMFPAMENDQFQAVQLPYRGDRVSMLILLPKTVDGLAALESGLSEKMLSDVLSKLELKQAELSIPKFKTTARLSLQTALEAMGIHRAFAPLKADFSGMDGRTDLFIGAVQHQGWVSVDEKGTEAAAATGVIMRPTAVFMPQFRFEADHPFFFLIRDNQTGVVLFAGRLCDPRQTQ
jgi:serpin B